MCLLRYALEKKAIIIYLSFFSTLSFRLPLTEIDYQKCFQSCCNKLEVHFGNCQQGGGAVEERREGREAERGEFMVRKEEVKEGLGKIPHNKIVNGKFWVTLVHRKKPL
jgi:hypothetical protein